MNIIAKYQTLVISLTALLLLAGCTDDDEATGEVGIGDSIPAFSLKSSDGREFDSVKDIDRTTLIVFFNTECPDCQKELPVIQQVFDSLGQDIHLLLMSREESEPEIDAYWKANGLTMPYWPQDDRTIFNLFAKSGIPRGYIIDGKRTVRYVFNDANMPGFSELRLQITNTYEQN